MKFTVLSLLISLVLFTGQINTSMASHTMGADLTYQCLGGDQYQITLSFYRDCSGISPDNKYPINIKSASCNISASIDLQKVAGTGQEITPICPTAKTTCNGGIYTGIEEYVYTGTFTLPKQCDDWIFSFDECCRNSAITTISNPSNQHLYVEAHLDNLNVTCNSSPTFSNKPVPFVCVGELFCFNHGATDIDGDSLVYSLVDPMNDPNGTVNYLTGYSATNPLKSSPALTFDASNGNFCVTPTQLEVTVMAVLVQEYRNGVLIGTVTRDIQVTDVTCNNQNPSIDGINGSGKFDTTICSGSNLCFTTNSFDADAGQTIAMNWNSGISKGTFTTSNGSLPVGTFCWTPKSKDVSTVPHCFTVEVKDDNCPYNGIQTYSFCITVTGLTVDAGTDQSISCTNTTTLSATASGGSGNYAYSWSTGDNTQTTTTGQGTHYLTVDDGAGCLGDDSVTVNYFDAPVADLSYVTGCSNPINFTDATTISGGPTIISWQWDFGDGNTSTQQNPSNNYVQGSYVVSLIATSSLGCPDTATKNISINAIPLANFSNVTVCEGQPTNFTDLSSISSGNIVSWQWDFGDNVTGNTQNPSHLYASAGTYTALLNITTDSNCVAQASYPVEVSSTPVASFITNDICLNADAIFTNTSTIAFGTIKSYTWNLGDGTIYLDSINATHQYVGANSYTVSLIAASSGGCADTITQPINVHAIPSAGFSASNVCVGLAIPFADLSTTNGSTITNWAWDFNNGIISSEQNPNPVFPTAGQINASLIITDNNGCADTATNTVNVYPMPMVSYNAQDVCLNDVSSFTDLSSISSGSIVSWQWDFNDGNTSTTSNATHTYNTVGSYTTQLIVTSDNGCIDSLEQIVTVNPLPEIDFSADVIIGCEDLLVGFTDLSIISTGSIASYTWNFGDGNSSSTQSPNYTYTTAGTYSVTLSAISDNGCESTATSTNLITVYPLPVSEYQYSPQQTSILFPLITFSDASLDAISWSWDFGDGSYSSDQFPTHAYADTGTYTVELLVVNTYGCLDSITYEVRINPDGVLYIPNTFSPNNNAVNDGFIAKGFGILDYEMRIYDRWGDLVYSCNDITKAWDGTIQSTLKPAPQDVYVYHINVRIQPDKKQTYIGRVSLVR